MDGGEGGRRGRVVYLTHVYTCVNNDIIMM